ncbi:MAG: hypothetical protein Q9193_006403 [Seirophora villosa]
MQNYGNSVAQQRAAQHLQQKYGPNANAQINQLQAQAAMSNPGPQQHNAQNIQLPQQLTEQQRRALAERHHQQMRMQQMHQTQQTQQNQQTQQTQQTQQRPQVSEAQTDGVGEWDDMVARRRAAALKDPGDTYTVDLTIRQQLEESSRAMEGGGLMLPLSEHPKRLTATPKGESSSSAPTHVSAPRIAQVDGPGDSDEDKKAIKDEDDEDAINSDLDDPDDNVAEEVGEDSNQGQIMLCTYDKVQRVKNKWKCILKDGVLTTGGKEYLFHKANGEFECIRRDFKSEEFRVLDIPSTLRKHVIEHLTLTYSTLSKAIDGSTMATDDALLDTLARDGSIDYSEWPGLLERLLQKLDSIAHHEFPIPSIPLHDRPPPSGKREILQQDPSNQDSQQNTVPDSPTLPSTAPPASTSSPPPQPSNSVISVPPGTLPPQLLSLLSSIKSNLQTSFPEAPPHTAQRLAELVLHPRPHYRTLPSYLRALDRVVSVSSPSSVFPLPSAAPQSSGSYLNGSISPENSNATSDPDDSLGGAALTPIPWLRHSMTPDTAAARVLGGGDLRRESTSVIDGPNGVGSVETVTVAMNGNNGRGSVTQGELIRQEQEAGVVPVPVVARNTGTTSTAAVGQGKTEEVGDEEDSIPHARGPEIIGMEDMGPQGSSQGFDVEAALGRKGEGEAPREQHAPGPIASKPEEGEAEAEAETDADGDVEVVDADGIKEGEERKADSVGQNVGSDAADGSSR